MIAVVFPGQGSQKPGMGCELFENNDAARRVFETVSEAIQVDMTALCFRTDEETLRQTQNAQIALYTVGLAAWWTLKDELEKFRPGAFAGHSVGEYAAIVSAEIVTITDGARMVRRRGELMSEAGKGRPGGMAAILGLDRGALEDACKQASARSEVVVVANDNCPGQLVISGDKAAVERACALATEAGAKRALPLNVSGAFHSPLMEDAASEFRLYLDGFTFAPPREGCSVYPNLTAQPAGPDANWPEILESQLRSPVRWTESVQNMSAAGAETFVECGVGEVLCGLIRRIQPDAVATSVSDLASLDRSLTMLEQPPTASSTA